VLKHLGGMGVARGVYALSQAVLLILLARDVGAHEFGIMASFLAAHTFLFLVAGMNTPTFVTREIALGNVATALAGIRANAIVMAIAMLCAAGSSLLAVSQPLMALAVAGNATAVWSERVTENRLAIAYGERRIGAPVATLMIRSLAPLGLYLGLGVAGVDQLLAFAIARVAAGIVCQLLGALLVRLPGCSCERVPLTGVLRQQASLAVSVGMVSLRTLDSVLVIAIAGASNSGVYSAVSRVVSPFGILAMATVPVLVPRAAVASPDKVRRILDALLIGGLLLSSVTLLAFPYREILVVSVLGPEFAGGGAVLAFALLRIGPYAVAPLIGSALQAKGIGRAVAINDAATSVMALIALAVGAIVAGATGAAAGFALVSLIGVAALWALGRRALRAKSYRQPVESG